ncbi:hypothetical protein ACJMK2_040305 [Sinanodonta woodiana]|uniref:Uncharacterized protein n=1 Tax=Sinanodonta woodiana TaxID=1069815 RepID=A0ABD3WEK6_SINWO
MKTLCLTVGFVLVTVVINVFSVCPESGCGCNEYCVNGNNIWCHDNNDESCSCKTGCFTVDTLLQPGERKDVYCNICRCFAGSSSAACSKIAWCYPKGFTLGVHYPDPRKKNPNCKK